MEHLTAAPSSASWEVTEKTKTVSTDVHSRRTRDSDPKLKQEDASWI